MIQCWCVCHKTEEPYDFEHSFEKANEERWKERSRKYQEYSDAHNGRVCPEHMHYDERTRKWHMRYEPSQCASMCIARNGCCPILGKELSRKRGNVYYDLKTSSVKKQEAQCSLFDGEKYTHVEKGIRYFEKPCSMDICEAFIKIESDKILKDYMMRHSWDFLFDENLKAEVLNIRAESRPSRDLMQDLQDIREGIQVTHASDLEKASKALKKERRQQAKKKKIEKLEKKILAVGYHNLPEYNLDRIHADKWLGEERIEELERLRKEQEMKPVQLSFEWEEEE